MLQELFSAELQTIEVALRRALGARTAAGLEPLWDSMGYSLLSGGKRFRPLLSLLTARALEKPLEQALPIAVAVEMIHTYSLIHDDLPCMDNDDMRRGQPTNHKVHGETLALLAGDALLTSAFGALAQASTGDVARAVALLSYAAGPAGMVGGQVLDIKSDRHTTVEQLQLIHQLKTGALIAVAVSGAAVLCEASSTQFEKLETFGGALGFAFQLADDIQDHSDEKPEKASYTSKLGVAATKELLEKTSAEALAVLSALGPGAEGLRQMIRMNASRI